METCWPCQRDCAKKVPTTDAAHNDSLVVVASNDNPFNFDHVAPSNLWLRLLFEAIRRPLFAALGVSTLRAWYDDIIDQGPREEFLQRMFERMKLSFEIVGGSLESIPKDGPLIVVGNHPFGMIEGCIISELLKSRRPDTRILANYLLERIKPIADRFIFVDPFETKEAMKKNVQPLKETLSWLNAGHVLAIFPAGTVSHLHLARREIADPPWSPVVGRLVRKSGASVLPIFFEGANGWFFQIAGLIHPRLRTLLLARQLVNKQNSKIRLKIGNIIPAEKLSDFRSDKNMLAYLRLRTYLLADKNRSTPQMQATLEPNRKLEPIIEADDPLDIQTEIRQLPERQLLLQNDNYSVFFARASQVPRVLREIGRLREVTFREVNEGTGKSFDLDRFDNYYTHLFLWNEEKAEIVGAYRLGKTDRIFRRLGKNGLYTSTLFNYKDELLNQLGPALELGRSFIRQEYQKSFMPLLLLWKGIGQYVVKNPRYRTLFGPVSINNEYESVSRQLIINFLKANNFIPELARLVKARTPMRPQPIRGLDAKLASYVAEDIHHLDDLMTEVQAKQKNIPVLLRQYLKLGGKLLGFNLDSSFGGVLDGLILVDLLETEPKLLERYLGKEGAKIFRAYHDLEKSGERNTKELPTEESTQRD